MLQDRLDDVRVVINAELIGHGQQERIGLGNGFVLLELLDEDVRFDRKGKWNIAQISLELNPG